MLSARRKGHSPRLADFQQELDLISARAGAAILTRGRGGRVWTLETATEHVDPCAALLPVVLGIL